MANIAKKALELISNLTEAGADPLEYMRVLEKQAAPKPFGVDQDAYKEILGFQEPSPWLRTHLRAYSGPDSYAYNQPYRLTKAKIAEDVALRQDALRQEIERLEKRLNVPWLSEIDKDNIREQLGEAERNLNDLSTAPFKGYAENSAKLLKTFHPAANDAVLYRGLNPGSKTAQRLNELERMYSARAEGFGEEFPIPSPTDYGNLGYLSTSVDPKIAKSFGDWSYVEDGGVLGDDPRQQLYKILVPQGTPVRPLLNQLSEHPNEAEVLLPPMSVYERLGDRDSQGFIPLLWTGRGKPISKRYIGATIPGAALLEQYYDAPEDQ